MRNQDKVKEEKRYIVKCVGCGDLLQSEVSQTDHDYCFECVSKIVKEEEGKEQPSPALVNFPK